MKPVFLLLGRSSAGKDEITRRLNKKGYTNVISYATRPKREGEGNTHYFIKPEEVQDYVNDMIAYTRIGEFEYFSTKQQLLNSDIYIIDYEGVKYLRQRLHVEDGIRLVVIYIYATPAECYARAMKRKDNIDTYKARVKSEAKQFAELEKSFDFDYCVHNVDLDKTVKVIEEIMEVERGES